MATKLASVGTIKKGNYVVIDGVASTVVDTQTSKTGKHGHAKVRLSAVGIMDGKKRDMIMPGHDNIEVPIIDKRSAQVLSVSGDKATVMDSESYETLDLTIPDELKSTVVDGVVVLYWEIMGEKQMKQVRGGGA
jgi:translation initiation factor 5A